MHIPFNRFQAQKKRNAGTSLHRINDANVVKKMAKGLCLKRKKHSQLSGQADYATQHYSPVCLHIYSNSIRIIMKDGKPHNKSNNIR